MTNGTIIYIGGMEMPDRNAAAHRVLNISKIFENLGYHIVFCGVDKEITKNAEEPIKIGTFDSYPSKYPYSKKEWRKQLFDFSYLKHVLDLYHDIRFVVVYNMHAMPLKNVLQYCKKRNIKVIADVTEWYQNLFSINPVKFIKWLDTKIVISHLHKKVDGVISISTFFTDYYRHRVKHIVQIPPMVDVEENVWKQAVECSKKIQFVYAGLPGRDKDKIGLILSAYLNIKHENCIFNIIGITREQFINDYPELTDAIDNSVIFHGRLSHKDSIKSLLKSDYCVFVRDRSRKNMAGFPTKFVECVTSGIGVITNDVSNVSDYFPRKNSILLKEDSINSITDAIEKSIKNGKIYHRICDCFDYHKYIDIVNNFLYDVANK